MASKRAKQLHRTGLIVGIVGVIEVIVWGLFNYEGGPSWIAIPPLSIYVFPFLAGILLAWKWPFGGGILLIIEALSLPLLLLAITIPLPINQPLLSLVLSTARIIFPIVLAPLVTGILFLLSSKVEHSRTLK